MNARRILLELFDAALRAVDGRLVVERHLRNARITAPYAVIAIGKAASAMARGAHAVLGDGIVDTLVITKERHVDADLLRLAHITIIESAHPVPDARSLASGAELERSLRDLPTNVLPIFLISGGSSSLAEWLRETATLEQLRTLNLRGFAAGWDIARLNTERARLSRLKAGGVARLLSGRHALALFISDVPGDDPSVIGSGLLGRDGAHSDAIERHVVANVDHAVQAVIGAAHAHGLEFAPQLARFDGDAHDLASQFVAALRDCRADGLAWGGESTVRLPANHGRGGRNTHLALSAARLLLADEPLMILAAGTDGSDGPTDDAGALIDARSVERAELGGCDVERAFREFDSGTALEAAEDLVHTGPTGTNVGDLLLGLRLRRGSLGED